MKITNNLGLPEIIVRAVTNDPYDKGAADMSATELIGPPQQRTLKLAHADEITEDVSDRIWALFGTSVHSIIERAAADNDLSEIRLFSKFGDITLSGAIDIYEADTGSVIDFKTTSVWKLVHGEFTDWTKQLNIYAELVRRNGGDVTGIGVLAMLRDWREAEAKRGGDYPERNVAQVPLELWPSDQTVAYINERIKLHQGAMAGENIPCTDDECWKQPCKWAVMKDGRQSAIRLLDTELAAADRLIEEAGKARDKVAKDGKKAGWSSERISKASDKAASLFYVEYRKGIYTRCARYCSVASFCKQAKERTL